MDKGEFIKDGYKVHRGLGDSWMVSPHVGPGEVGDFISFTTSEDLIKWLTEEHRVLRTGGAEPGDRAYKSITEIEKDILEGHRR